MKSHVTYILNIYAAIVQRTVMTKQLNRDPNSVATFEEKKLEGLRGRSIFKF